VGSYINLPGVPPSQEHDSLLLAISTSCHFCQESLPFYRELSAKTQGKLDLIAVLPQPLAESQTFLQKGALSVTRVVSTNLNQFGVLGTPTILLVDTHGRVQEEWLGFQDDKARQQVLARILQ
jgi:hypothetical protein